ncbi:MAG: GDP-L-fucose synthase [Verrucomicrobiales bacterium]|jgi:GDP-L-fucose synthase
MIYVAGHTGMVGSALVRRFGESNTITATRSEVDLTQQLPVREFLNDCKPKVVVIAAARVGGIHANSTYPADFIYDNLMIESNLVHESFKAGVSRVLFLGSSCIYPKLADKPMREDALLTGPLEATNEAYAIAKIAGLKLCEFYRRQHGVLFHSAMPTNLYGPGDNYHPDNSHVIPGMIRRFHEAKLAGAPSVTIWGTGTPLREFLHVDDLASACEHLLTLEDPPDLVNVGSGSEISTGDLAKTIAEVVGFRGRIENDLSKPDGTPRKLMDSSTLRKTGWKEEFPLDAGLRNAYADFLARSGTSALREV